MKRSTKSKQLNILVSFKTNNFIILTDSLLCFTGRSFPKVHIFIGVMKYEEIFDYIVEKSILIK